MNKQFARISICVSALLAFAVPAANALAQGNTGRRAYTPPPAGPVATPQGVTGTDPQPTWPPSATVQFTIK